MSCDNASAPLNLIKNFNMLEKCSVTCEYKFNYPACRGSIVNKGVYLSIIMEACSVNVSYNRDQFSLTEVRIYQPSLHAWDNNKADGEIIIIHKRKIIVKDKPDELFVCIPIKMGNTDNSWFKFMPLVPSYFDNADNNPVGINLSGWTLNTIIPNGDYYNYQGTSPFIPCENQVEIIVYSLDQATICSMGELNMLKSTLPKEFNIVPRTYDKTKTMHKLFYRTSGSEKSGEVYLDCRDVNGDDPVDTDQGNSDAVASPYKGFEGEEAVSTTKVPYGPILISAGSVIALIILIKIWDKIKASRK